MATLALSVAGQFIGGAIGGPIGATIGRALGALAGSVVDQALFAEKPQQVPGANIRLSGSAEGGAVPRLFSSRRTISTASLRLPAKTSASAAARSATSPASGP